MVRPSGRLYPQIIKKILDVLETRPISSTHEIALLSDIGWATAQKYLNHLKKEGLVNFISVGSQKRWSKR